MAHIFRFLAQPFASSAPQTPRLWTVREDELWQLRKVLRLKPGAEVEVFDGRGRSGRGVLEQVDSDLAHVLVQKEQHKSAPTPSLSLAIGALKPGFMDELLPFLVELGIDRVYVFAQEGSASGKMPSKEKVFERWGKIVLSSAKQCRQDFLPEVHAFASQDELLKRIQVNELQNGGQQGHKFLLSLESQVLLTSALSESRSSCSSMLAAIAGEGGFSPHEEQVFQQGGFLPVSLGPLILRSFTAAVAVSVLLSNLRSTRQVP